MSSREFYALSAALLVLGLSFSMQYMFIGLRPLEILEVFLLTIFVIGTGFLGHELAHKFTAQRYGCWAEFKLWTVGAIMALLFAVISRGIFIFAAPGAVYIASRSSYFGEGIDRRANGIVSLAGPLLNVGAAAIFGLALAASPVLGFSDLTIGGSFHFLLQGMLINVWLGAFNMIPFFILDGQKVYAWDRRIWAAVAIPLWVAFAILSVPRLV
jgi:Zn-dependent protease